LPGYSYNTTLLNEKGVDDVLQNVDKWTLLPKPMTLEWIVELRKWHFCGTIIVSICNRVEHLFGFFFVCRCEN
jgi:hypothetical protein